MSVLSERIRQVRDRAGATLEVLGEKIGVSKQAVYQYEMYEDLTNDLRVRMRARGRVVYPTDSPQAILRTFAQQMAEVLRQR